MKFRNLDDALREMLGLQDRMVSSNMLTFLAGQAAGFLGVLTISENEIFQGNNT